MLLYSDIYRWMGILGIVFGSMCAGIGGAKNISTLMVLRFLLGVAEAGVLPGILFYLSFWYGPRARALRISVIICAIALSGAFGGTNKASIHIFFPGLNNNYFRSHCLRRGLHERSKGFIGMALAVYHRGHPMRYYRDCLNFLIAQLPRESQVAYTTRERTSSVLPWR